MPVPTDITAGTISISGSTVTGVGTSFVASDIRQGDLFIWIEGGAGEWSPIVETVTSNTVLTLAEPWTGPTISGARYRLRYQWDSSRVSAQSRQLIEMLDNGNVLALAGLTGPGVPVFDGPHSMTIRPETDFINGVAYDVQVDTLADRAAYDGQASGFAVLVSDVGDGRSAVYSKASNASGDWTDPAYITGPIGAAPNIAAGTTTTLPPGSDATFDVAPDGSGGYLLNAGIPEGEGFYWAGTYNSANSYLADRVVSSNGSTFIALQAVPAGQTPSGATPPVDNAYWAVLAARGLNGTGTGDVVGPSGAVNNRIAVFSGTTGKLIADSGVTVDTISPFGVNIKSFGAVGDGSTDDRAAILSALTGSVSQGKVLIVPEGTYQVSGWLPLPDKLKMWFAPGAVFRQTAGTPGQGHFLCGGYNISSAQTPFTDVEIWNMTLDCNGIAGENAFASINGDRVRLYSPKIFRTRHDPSILGGRAFQFEGASITGIDVYSPYIEDCSIGINSHADPANATEVVRGVHYFDVVMKNVDIPFNIDGRFTNPQNGNTTNMSSYVNGVALENCGRPRWTGGPGVEQGAIIASDRGFGLVIDGLRLVNTSAYGKIGSFVRGPAFDLKVTNAKIDAAAGMNQLVNFNPLSYSGATTTAFASRVNIEVDVRGPMGVIATSNLAGRIGRSHLDVTYGSDASLSGLFDNIAATADNATARFTYRDTAQQLPVRSFAAYFEGGNSFAGLLQSETGIERIVYRRNNVASAQNTGLITIDIVPGLRVSIDYVMTISMINSGTRGSIVARGTVAIAVTQAGVLMHSVINPQTGVAANAVTPWTATVSMIDLTDGRMTLAVNQTNAIDEACTVSLKADIDCFLGTTPRQPKIGRL